MRCSTCRVCRRCLVHVEFIVPTLPVGKGRHRTTRTGRTYTPQKTVSFQATVGWYATHAMQGDHWGGPVEATLSFHFLVPRSWSQKRQREAGWYMGKPDLDNAAKAILDACNGVVYRDDAQVVQLTCRKTYGSIACVVVRFSQLEACDGLRDA
jgi:Holliday junction resolvase RusA-like endonuclease